MAARSFPATPFNGMGVDPSFGNTLLFVAHSYGSNSTMELGLDQSRRWPILVFTLFWMGLPTASALPGPIVNHYAFLFFASLYSVGAVLARRVLGFARYQDKKHFSAIMFAGVIILAAFIVDLAISVHQGGWHGSYLLSALSPMGLGAFLLYVGSTIRRQPAPSAQP